MKSVCCPRCGYDLQGIVASWTGCWPLRGDCTECGLDIEWRQLLDPTLERPSWSMEYARRWWSYPWRCVQTWGLLHWPWGFWRSLRMTHPPAWGRLVGFAAMLIIAAYLVLAGSTGVLAYAEAEGTLAMYAANPNWGAPPIRITPWRHGLEAAALPLPHSPIHYVFEEYWAPRGRFLPWLLTIHVMCGMSFLLLPASRRKAKVRARHIVRITAYSAVPSLTVLGLWSATGLFNDRPPASVAWIGHLLSILFLLYVIAWPCHAVAWWSTATGRYLKMPHAWGVGVSAVLIGFLGTLAIATIGVIAGSESLLQEILVDWL